MLSLFSFNYFYKRNSQQSTKRYWYNHLLNSKVGVPFFYTTNFQTLNLAKIPVSNYFATNFRIFFIRKEFFYTKLKYSRVPQFDTSSGASASFLSGLYGFMVCEKFGFELIDSGDFLFMAMYIFAFALIVTNLVSIFNGSSALTRALADVFKSFKWRI